ncbi:hypothetical protein [Candidatus Uabimicrobium sp. HlEnr_7]|uniref:hypothetical protein n=1 Tax=Candidatus Uabimicrobium helgolandensis TaxID=3095367 RepID=UPI00355928EF
MKVLIVVVAICYSLLRYAWASGVYITNWPAYIGNKAMAFCAVSFLVTALFKKTSNNKEAKEYFYLSSISAIAHAAMSMAILHPEYYNFLFSANNKLNIFGEFTILFGSLGFGIFVTTSQHTFAKDIALLSIIFAHITSVGILKWIEPQRWAYGLVPISLISGTIIIIGAIIRTKAQKKQKIE